MSIKSNYNGPTYVSKDGNVFDNPWDARAADTRYEQQQNIYKELKRQNDLMQYGKTTNDTEVAEAFMAFLFYTKVGCGLVFVVSMLILWFTLTNFTSSWISWISLGVGIFSLLRMITLGKRTKQNQINQKELEEQPKQEEKIVIRFGNKTNELDTAQHESENSTQDLKLNLTELDNDDGPIKNL